MIRINLPASFISVLMALPLLIGCSVGHTGGVPASVSGVNYTENDIRYRLFDPADGKQTVLVSEEIGPFAAGGVLCCYEVPRTWRPGIKVGVFLESFDNKALEYRPRQSFIVDLPPYDKSGKAGDVWFINYPDGTVGVVSTAYRPNGDEWPGKIKGWPKPSFAYQRELWERDMRLAQEGIAPTRSLIADFEANPAKSAKESWESRMENGPAIRRSLDKYTGPEDPNFLEDRRKELKEVLHWEQKKIDQLLKVKP